MEIIESLAARYGLLRLCKNTFQKSTALQFSVEARMFKVYNVVTDPVHQRTLSL